MTGWMLYSFHEEGGFVNRIKELRTEKGLKQGDLAVLLNVTKATVSKYELGQRDIGSETIGRLCEIFGCTADYLLGLSDLQRSELSEMEISVLLAYRKADEHVKDLVRLALDPYWQEGQSAKAI